MLETPYAVCAMAEIREIAEDELERWVATTRAALDEADTVESYLDWKRQARETIWLLATKDGTDVGTAIGVGGWHSPEGVARGEVRVVGDVRGRGVGSSLLAELSSWASSLGYAKLMGPVKETDDVALAWAERRGFVEVGRNSLLVLDLTGIEAPAVVHPDGVEIVSWAERPDPARWWGPPAGHPITPSAWAAPTSAAPQLLAPAHHHRRTTNLARAKPLPARIPTR